MRAEGWQLEVSVIDAPRSRLSGGVLATTGGIHKECSLRHHLHQKQCKQPQ